MITTLIQKVPFVSFHWFEYMHWTKTWIDKKIGEKRGKGGREREFKLMPICYIYFIEPRM